MATLPRPVLADPGPALDPWEGVAGKLDENLRAAGAERETGEFTEQVRRQTFRSWTAQVPEERGPVDLARFAYQREWYEDKAATDREQGEMKANQVGASTRLLRLGMYHADRGLTVIYAFPTDDELARFSRERIGPVIRRSPYLTSRMDSESVNRVDQKQIGWGWVHFAGTQKPIESIAADALLIDEYDFCNQENLEQSERRVTGPMSAGIIRRTGIPTVPGYGISRFYNESDQRAWTVKCGACGEWNRMEGYDAFEHNVDQEALRVVCRACRKPIDVKEGEWVSAHPERAVRCYHVPKLIVPGQDLRYLVRNANKRGPLDRQSFFNRDLGEPFAPAEGQLSLDQLQACQRQELHLLEGLRTDKLVTMGIDQASARPLNVVIEEAIDQETTRVVWAGRVEDGTFGRSAFDALCYLMVTFGVKMAGIDNGPDGRFAREFADRFPGRVYRVGYFTPGPQQRKEPPPWHVDDDERFVSVWRVKAIDATFERFRMQLVLLPPLELLPDGYATELGNLVRRSERTPSGNIVSGYHRIGSDDFAHAHVYSLVGIELFWRNSGLQTLHGQGPAPIAESLDFQRSDLSSYSDDPDYRPGPDDGFGPGLG